MEQKQMAILLGRHQIFLDLEGVPKAEKLIELNSNTHLHTYFHSLARELDIMEPKTPEAIYKSHLEQSRPFAGSSAPDSARSNLAAAFVNGFVNRMLSAAASQGLVWRWDIDSGLSQCDRFLYVNDDYIKVIFLLSYYKVQSKCMLLLVPRMNVSMKGKEPLWVLA
ncbi:unnamed protein product [Gongylonema pulchrum]|uniref:RPN1 N-terminal domain-containing protein n=1 Tax=Gongylonema pulchrum TaxID=637853 RepID=A0A3P7PBI4_9BILA|nr:unnamed protein product [Gongylonema pulchrum]